MPVEDATLILQLSASRIGFTSEMGLAVAMFPPNAAMLRTCVPAKYLMASRSARSGRDCETTLSFILPHI